MKLETFFGKFDLLADLPNGVEKLRELVRQLAVTGTLVDQDPNDEPALALLDRIAAHKISLAKEGKLRGPTTVAPMSPDEGPRDLPSSWAWVRFGEIVVNRDGERIPVSKEERATKAKTYDYYGASGVIDKIDGYLFDKPLLLIGEDGANLINRSTPIAFIARGQYWVNNHAHVLDGISEDFLRYIELHINAINLESYITGSAQPKMNQAKLNSIPIALPPLAEQKRIVAKVDELMALCDRLEAQQQERETRHAALARASLSRFAKAPTPSNLQLLFHNSYDIAPADLRKCIFDLAVFGHLTTRSPDEVEVPSIERFREAAASLANSLALRPSRETLDESVPPFDVPNHWRWIALADLGAAQTGTTPSKNDYEAFSGDIPFIKPADILPEGINYSNESLTRYGAESGGRLAPAGSLLMVCIGTIGKCNLIQRECAFNQQINSLSPVPWVDSQYLLLAVRAQYFQDAAWRKSSSTTIAILNKSKWLSIPVPIPPLAEQRRIVAKVEQLMALVDALETQLATSRATAANLLSALVGELTQGAKD